MKREEICYAKKVLRTMHPLYNLDIEICLPFLDPCIGVARRNCCAGKKEVNEEERKGLAASDQLKESKDLELQLDGERGPDEPLFDFFLEEGEDAMTRLGYGIVSYFSLIYTFMLIFFMISLLNIPVMYNNHKWSAFEQYNQISWTTQFTIGNLGGSEARCLNLKLVSESLSVSCSTGTISEITHFGVYQKDSEADQRGLCTSSGVSVSTGLSCDRLSSKEHPFYTDKLATCIGQPSCMLSDIHAEIPIGSNGEGCTLTEQDSVFIQYNCVISDEELAEKREQALLASCVNIFAALTLLSVIAYRQGSNSIEKKEWDLQTVTASDYTLEISLSQLQVSQMRRDIYQNSFEYYESDGYQVKFWIKKLVEDRLYELSGKRGYQIADINFAYYNSWLLDGLRRRGTLIKYQKWAELNQLNRELTEKLHAPNEEGSGTELQNVVTPKCAFVSFESEEAYNIMADQSEMVIGGETSKVTEAPEPTNVIWENRDFDKHMRYTNLVYVIAAVLIVLFITFLATVQAKAMTNDLVGKYDESVPCKEMEKMYKGDTLGQLAADEWLDYYKNGGDDIGRQIAPTLSCFCTD